MISFGFKRVSTPSAIQFWCHFEQFKMLKCFKTFPTWRNFQTETKWKIILNRGKFNVLSTPNLVKNLGKTLCLAIEIDLKAIWVSLRKLHIQMTTVACPDSMEMKCKACRLCFMLRTYSMWVCQCVCLCVCVCVCMCVRHSWQLAWKSLPIVSQWSRPGLIASSYFHLQTTVFI